MIKGKFYTGLPSEMMTRSRVVNRQETNFFWPDESHMESVSARAKRTTAKSTLPVTNFNNESTESDIKPRELFRKQLTSGIEFYDNVNAKTPESRRRRFKKIDNVNLNNSDSHFQPERKKLEAFSSKIEFYDFEKETDVKNKRNAKIEQPVKPMKKGEDEVKTRNDSPDVNKKRISFQTAERTKGILKKNDDKMTAEKVVVKPLPKRGLLPKNLSKSVENISKMAKSALEDDLKADKEPEKLSTIINEVKNLNLSQERKQIYDRYEPNEDETYYSTISSYDREPRRNNIDRDYSPRYSDRYESRGGYRDEPDFYRHSEEKNHRNDVRRDDHRDNRYDYRRGRDYIDRYDRREPPPRETYKERRYEERRYDESPVRERYSGERRHYDRDYDREFIKSPVPRKPSESHYEKPPRSTRYEEEYSTISSRSPKQLPQHLRSNILFNGHVRPQSQRPLSVRDSAVTRVGVGLPDIE